MSRTVRRGLSDEYGILEHDLDRPAELPELPLGDVGHVPPVEDDAPGCHRQQAQDQPPDRRLAASALAHEAERLSRIDVKGDVVHRPEDARAYPELPCHPFDGQQRGQTVTS